MILSRFCRDDWSAKSMTTALQDGEKRFEYDTYNTLFFGFIHVVDKLAGTGWRKT